MTIIVVCRFKNPPPTADSLIDLRHVCCDLFFQFLDEEDHLQAIFAVNFSGFHRFHHFWVWDQIGKVWKRRYPYMFWGVGFDGHFSQVGKHHFADIAHKELRRLWRQIPTKIGKPQPSSVMRPLTTPISTVHLCIDPNPNRSFRRLRVARVRCESAIYSWMIHQVSQVFHSHEEMIPKSYSQITEKYTATFLLQYHIFSSIIPC